MAPATPPTPPPAVEPSHGIVAQLRAWTRLMTLVDMAHVFGYEDNPKRVYELPIKRAPIGPGGDRALRWDPADVANYIEARMKMPPETSESSAPADDDGACPPAVVVRHGSRESHHPSNQSNPRMYNAC